MALEVEVHANDLIEWMMEQGVVEDVPDDHTIIQARLRYGGMVLFEIGKEE